MTLGSNRFVAVQQFLGRGVIRRMIQFARDCLALTMTCGLLAGCGTLSRRHDTEIAVLNHLRNEINSVYGYRDGAPRINLGPCGRFAKAFREEWNARFRDQINIVFIMSSAEKECYHVLLKLPNGDYYDGGNGVISSAALLQQYAPGTRLDEMIDFDLKRLDKWSYGLSRDYPLCTNYSDEVTLRLIKHHLDSLASRD